MEMLSNMLHIVTEISKETPIIEKANIDEFYLNLSGMDTFWDAITGLIK